MVPQTLFCRRFDDWTVLPIMPCPCQACSIGLACNMTLSPTPRHLPETLRLAIPSFPCTRACHNQTEHVSTKPERRIVNLGLMLLARSLGRAFWEPVDPLLSLSTLSTTSSSAFKRHPLDRESINNRPFYRSECRLPKRRSTHGRPWKVPMLSVWLGKPSAAE